MRITVERAPNTQTTFDVVAEGIWQARIVIHETVKVTRGGLSDRTLAKIETLRPVILAGNSTTFER